MRSGGKHTVAASAKLVDLSPGKAGDRIAVVRDGLVEYLPACASTLGRRTGARP